VLALNSSLRVPRASSGDALASGEINEVDLAPDYALRASCGIAIRHSDFELHKRVAAAALCVHIVGADCFRCIPALKQRGSSPPVGYGVPCEPFSVRPVDRVLADLQQALLLLVVLL